MSETEKWVFPVPEKIANISGSLVADSTKGISVDKRKLLQAMFRAVDMAWEQVIKPSMSKIRLGNIVDGSMKVGTDFFTEADIQSEEIIKQTILKEFGEDTFRIWGEEANKYLGNLDSNLTIRIDPIDSTENFKFGNSRWSIMIGIYTGRESQERQVMSAIFYPEYYNEVLYRVDGLGVFVTNRTTGMTEEIDSLDPQDSLDEIYLVVSYGDVGKRGNVQEVVAQLELKGARVKSTSTVEAKEALQTRGRRAVITSGTYGQQDYISYSALASLGYRVFDRNGTEYNMDDPALSGMATLIVPPGKAGEEIVKAFTNS